MADNLTLPATGQDVATKDLSGVHFQKVILYTAAGDPIFDDTLDALRTVQVNQQQVLFHELWHESDRAGNPITLSSTTLNALGAGAAVLETSTVSNDTERDMYVDLELVIPVLAAAPADGDTLANLYWVRQIDGTNFETASATGPILPRATPDAVFKARGIATAQRMIVPGLLLPPRSFRYLIVNADATAWSATLNTLKGYFYGTQGYHPGA